MAIIIAVVLALVSIGLMVGAFIGYKFNLFPSPVAAPTKLVLTPTVLQATGLKVEKVGQPQRNGDTVTVRVKVTNMVHMTVPIKGTPSPTADTPTPAPADLYNATIKVLFTRTNGNKKVIVGSGVGNVTDLGYGQSKEVEVMAVPVGDFTDYEVFPDSVTNKASIKPNAESVTPEGTTNPTNSASPTP